MTEPHHRYLDQLSAATAQRRYGYLDLLLDPAADGDNWLRRIALIQPPLEYLRLFDDTPLSDLRQDSPLLVRVMLPQPSHCDWLDSTLSMLWLQPQWLALLSPSPLPTLAQQLRRCLLAELDDGATTLLRYYDPRLLRVVQHALAPEQAAALNHNIDCWLWRNRDGELASLSPLAGNIPAAEAPLRLNAEQRQQLETYVEAHALLQQRLEDEPELSGREALLDQLAALSCQADAQSLWEEPGRGDWIAKQLAAQAASAQDTSR